MATLSTTRVRRPDVDAPERFRPRAAHAAPVLAVLVVGPALTLGGAPAWSVPLWTTVALGALSLTGIDVRSARRDRLVWAAAVLIGISVLQLLPLPPFLLHLIDARSADVSAGALSPFRIDRSHAWRALHLDPGTGYAELQYLVGLLAAYLAARRAVVRGSGESIFDALCAAPLVLAGIGAAHKWLDLEKVYGIYTPLQGNPPVLSPVLNPNHLAALVGAGCVLWAGRALDARLLPERILSGSAAALCAGICALTLSRGGILATLGGIGLLVLTRGWVRGATGEHFPRRAFAAALVGTLIVSAGLYVGWNAIRAEYAGQDLSKLATVLRTFRLVAQHPVLGTGSGGLGAALASAGTLASTWTMRRAESLPIDLMLAFGPVVGLAVMALAARWLWSLRPEGRVPASYVAVLCALVSVIAHDLVDFSLWLGATGFFTAVMAGWIAGTLARPGHGTRPTVRRSTRVVPVVLTVLSALAAFVTVRSPLWVDQDRVQAAVASPIGSVEVDSLRAAHLRHPGDAYLPLSGAVLALRRNDPRSLRFIARAMRIAPSWSEPHAVLARALIARGLTSQGLLETRYAVGLSERYHTALAQLVVARAPDAATLARTVPDGPLGIAFLREVARIAGHGPISIAADQMLLARDPSNIDALGRTAQRASGAGDRVGEAAAYEQMMRAHPTASEGYVGMSQLRANAGEFAAAEAVLHRGVQRGANAQALLLHLASLQARRHDGPAMRRTIQQLMDMVGADTDRRVALYGQLGSFEASLQNDALALGAYERADAMAFPGHPYAAAIVGLAARLNDLPRLRGACGVLADDGAMGATERATCNSLERLPASALEQTLPSAGRGSGNGS